MTDHKVELHIAFMWDCDVCGQENFERAVEVEQTDDLPDQGEPGDWLIAPTRVTCRACKTAFDSSEQSGDVKW